MMSKLIFPVLILIFFVVLLIKGSLELSIDAMLFPWITGIFGSILLLWELARTVRKNREEKSGKIREEKGVHQWGNYLSGFTWVIAILPMIYLLGFLVAIPLFLFVYLKSQGERWLLCLSIAFVGEALFYLFFIAVLRVHFYEGLLFSYLMS